MILDTHAVIKINATTIKYWKAKGYIIPQHIDSKGRVKTFKRGVTTLKVLITDLPKKSNIRIKAKCEECAKERIVPFSKYSSNCWRCNLNFRKGIKHPRYLSRVKTGGSDRAFDLYLRRRYNITLAKFKQLILKQNFKCAICSVDQSELDTRLSVDHCHVTGAVRGLLCKQCNSGLGSFKDSVLVIKKAIDYLEVSNG